MIALPISQLAMAAAVCLAGFPVCDLPVSAAHPFSREDISITSGSISLAGTLLLPDGEGPFPAVVFVHGSGPSTREDFREFAEAFASLGYAALAYDKRGSGESGGDPESTRYFSLEDLAADAQAAVAFLAAHGAVRRDHIGLYVASQGGWVGPLAAVRSDLIAFMIVQSGSVCTIAEDNYFERAARLRSEGFSAQDIEDANAMHLVDLALTRNPDAETAARFTELWHQHQEAAWFRRVYLNDALLDPEHAYRKWYRTVCDFDPRPHLQQLDIPVLWLYGAAEYDRLCPVEQSIAALEKLKSEEGKRFEIKSFPGADHQLNVDGDKAPIGEVIAEWLNRHLGE